MAVSRKRGATETGREKKKGRREERGEEEEEEERKVNGEKSFS